MNPHSLMSSVHSKNHSECHLGNLYLQWKVLYGAIFISDCVFSNVTNLFLMFTHLFTTFMHWTLIFYPSTYNSSQSRAGSCPWRYNLKRKQHMVIKQTHKRADGHGFKCFTSEEEANLGRSVKVAHVGW